MFQRLFTHVRNSVSTFPSHLRLLLAPLPLLPLPFKYSWLKICHLLIVLDLLEHHSQMPASYLHSNGWLPPISDSKQKSNLPPFHLLVGAFWVCLGFQYRPRSLHSDPTLHSQPELSAAHLCGHFPPPHIHELAAASIYHGNCLPFYSLKYLKINTQIFSLLQESVQNLPLSS